MNANDSYWLPNPKSPIEGYDHIIGCEQCERTLRTRMVDRYVLDRLAGKDGLAQEQAGQPPHAAGDRAREPRLRRRARPRERRPADRLRVGRRRRRLHRAEEVGRPLRHRQRRHAHLPGVLEARPGGQRALGDAVRPERPGRRPRTTWPRPAPRSSRRCRTRWPSSRTRASRRARPGASSRWPATTGPRRSRSAAARASPATPTRWPAGCPGSNLERLYPISYGSSHIQAIAFKDHGRLSARTILTYGESMDPTQKISRDQTRLFSQEKWVRFPWTDAQIRARHGAHVRRQRPLSAGPSRTSGRRSAGRPGCKAGGVRRSSPRSWVRTRERIRETCIWVTPISSAICDWVCWRKNRR